MEVEYGENDTYRFIYSDGFASPWFQMYPEDEDETVS